MQIAIIGGGISGLVSAYKLSLEHEITIYEKSEELGGLLASYQREQYAIERFYHHFFSGDSAFLDLLAELGLSGEVLWLRGSTGTYQNGRIYPLTTPLEILRYPLLSLSDKIRLALFTKKVKHLDLAPLDGISAEKFLVEQLGESIYKSFFRPLLKSKFGENAENVSAAWVVSRVAIRSDRSSGGERLGYIRRGFSEFISAISTVITQNGGDIRMQSPVHSLSHDGRLWHVNNNPYDCVISTIAPGILQDLGITIPDIPYQGAACLTMGLPRQVTDGIYWINLYDDAPYGAVIGHTCLVPEVWYGEHIVYLASYYTGQPAPDLKETMIQDFCRKFSVIPDEIRWAEIWYDPYAGPLYLAGYQRIMQKIAVPDLYLAGMFSSENYPERSIEGSVRAGLRVSDEILRSANKPELCE